MFCVNPDCHSPEDPGQAANCIHCGTQLLINDRYRPLHPLRPIAPFTPTHIFEVEDTLNQSRKVLKVLVQPSAQRIQQIEREYLALGLLDAPRRIPEVELDAYFTFTTANNQSLHCLVMEKIEGQNLLQWHEAGGTLTEAQAINWLRQLTEILKIIHGQNFFHRDIKPANIMLCPDGQLALVDFGAVRRVTDSYLMRLRLPKSSSSSNFNITNITAIGSPGYDPPEQVGGRAVPASDFFALGRTFVHLLTGIHPIRLPVTSDDPNRLRWHNHALHVSAPLARLLDSLMSPVWGQRPATPEAILSLLDSLPRQIRRDRFLLSWQFKVSVVVSGLFVAILLVAGMNALQAQQQQRQAQQRQEKAQQLLEKGAQAQVSGQYEEAREKYEEVLKLDPNSAQAYNSIALLCQSQGKIQCAIENYQKSLDIEPDRPATLYNLGSLYDDLGDYPNARKYYNKLLLLRTIPGIDAKNNLARLENIQGNYEAAIKLATQTLPQTSDPISQASILKNLAWAQFKLGQFDQAGDNLEKARRLEARTDIYCLLSLVRQAQGRTDDSKINGRQCLQRNDSTSGLPEVQQWKEQLVNRLLQ